MLLVPLFGASILPSEARLAYLLLDLDDLARILATLALVVDLGFGIRDLRSGEALLSLIGSGFGLRLLTTLRVHLGALRHFRQDQCGSDLGIGVQRAGYFNERHPR